MNTRVPHAMRSTAAALGSSANMIPAARACEAPTVLGLIGCRTNVITTTCSTACTAVRPFPRPSFSTEQRFMPEFEVEKVIGSVWCLPWHVTEESGSEKRIATLDHTSFHPSVQHGAIRWRLECCQKYSRQSHRRACFDQQIVYICMRMHMEKHVHA